MDVSSKMFSMLRAKLQIDLFFNNQSGYLEQEVLNDYTNYLKKTIRNEKLKLYTYMQCPDNEVDFKNLYCCKNGELNDLYEGIPGDIDNTLLDKEDIDKLSQIAYVRSFSETYTNPVMWAHYADNSRGLCLEYDICNMPADVLNKLLPVIYTDERIVKSDVMSLCHDIKDVDENTKWVARDCMHFFIEKWKEWEYEKEWRFIVSNYEIDSYEFTPDKKYLKYPCIAPSKIYLGVAITKENREKILSAVNNYNNHETKTIAVDELVVNSNIFSYESKMIC